MLASDKTTDTLVKDVTQSNDFYDLECRSLVIPALECGVGDFEL